jgi:hypothetical protein
VNKPRNTFAFIAYSSTSLHCNTRKFRETGSNEMATNGRDDGADALEVGQIPVGSITAFFREHPAIVGTLLYLQATEFGIAYSWGLYRRFGINVFDYAELNDFLLAAFKGLSVFVIAFMYALLFPVVYLYIVRATMERMSSRYTSASPASRAGMKLPLRALSWPLVLVLYVILALLLTFATGWFFSTYAAQDLVKAEAQMVSVRYQATSKAAEQTTETNLKVIGNTQQFTFFYDTADQSTLVVPHAQIVWIRYLPQ